MTTSHHYDVTAQRDGEWWLIEVPDVGATQSRTLSAAHTAAEGLIRAMLDLDDDAEVDITLTPQLGNSLDDEVSSVRQAVSELVQRQNDVGTQSRKVVAQLINSGLSGRDTAAMLGISPARVSQLMHSL